MKKAYQLGLAVTTIILIIASVVAIATLTYAVIQKVSNRNANESISLANIIEQFKEDWRPVLKASAFEADPLEQYPYNLAVKEEKEVNLKANLNENANINALTFLTNDWLSYSNREFGVGFKYPTEWGEIQIEKNDYTGEEYKNDPNNSGKGFYITFSENSKIWFIGASSDYTQSKTIVYRGGDDLSKKCENEGIPDEEYLSICKNITVAGQSTYENILLAEACSSFISRKGIYLNSNNEDYPGLYIYLRVTTSQECTASDEANKEARKTDLENLYVRTNLDEETLSDLGDFDLFLSTIKVFKDEGDTNTNANANVNDNININANKNVNLNENINTNLNINENLNTNLNVNLNSNTNINENLNLNLNANTNANANVNENLNANLNQNINENLNVNLNQNMNINKNTNANLNKNLNQNLNQNLNKNTNTATEPEKPKPTDEDKWYKKVKDGTLVFQANWYCSAAGMRIYPNEPEAFTEDIGRWHGDCTNPSVQVKGNFKPVILGKYKKGKKISFRLESDLHKVYKTVYTNVKDKCYIDYFPFSGRKDVPAIQYTCDDGYDIGLWDDIQFTVYVFPKGAKIDIPEVIPKEEVDSDGDGLTDAKEAELGTNRIQFDTDNDGYSDKTEIDSGYDPLTSAPTPNPDPETYEKKYYFTIPKVEVRPVPTTN